MLIDFDLAVKAPFQAGANEERRGTAPFMAQELLFNPNCLYGVHHDFESFLYTAIWHGVGYSTNAKYPLAKGEEEEDVLYAWRTRPWYNMAFNKVSFLTSYMGQSILSHIPNEQFAEKCSRLKGLFGTAQHKVALRILESRLHPSTEVSDAQKPKVTFASMMDSLDVQYVKCTNDCCMEHDL